MRHTRTTCDICGRGYEYKGERSYWMTISMEEGSYIGKEPEKQFIWNLGGHEFHICRLACLGKFIDELQNEDPAWRNFRRKE